MGIRTSLHHVATVGPEPFANENEPIYNRNPRDDWDTLHSHNTNAQETEESESESTSCWKCVQRCWQFVQHLFQRLFCAGIVFSEAIQGNGHFHHKLKETLRNDYNCTIMEGNYKKLVFVYPCSRDEDEIEKCDKRFGDIAAIMFLHKIHSSQSNEIFPSTHPETKYPVFSIYYNENDGMHDIEHNKRELKRMKTLPSDTD